MKNSIATIFQLVLLSGLLSLSTQLQAQEKNPQHTSGKTAVANKVSAEKATAKATAKAAVKAEQPSTRADRLNLDTTLVTGNSELPKVLYIVPWKKAELGELPAQPFNTLLDEVLQPVDREVFRREVKYYQTVTQPVTQAISSGAVKGVAGTALSSPK